MSETALGQSLGRALTLRRAIDVGIQVRLEDVPADEFNALVTVKAELEKYQLEMQQRPKEED